jgi:hypothetical protein
LCLQQVTLQPTVAEDAGALGAPQLLQLLARLTALRTLELLNVEGDWPQQQLLSAHSMLTASSDLQHLILHADIKPAAWVHVFPVGRKLPHLRTFEAFSSDRLDDEVQRLLCYDVTRLVSCCPNLQQLGFNPPIGYELVFGPALCCSHLQASSSWSCAGSSRLPSPLSVL